MTKTNAPAAGEVSKWSIWILWAFLLVYVVGAGLAIYFFADDLVDDFVEPNTQGAGLLTQAERITAITAARQALLLAAGGVLAVMTLALTLSRDAVARARHEIDRDANRTTRYTEAVKQLGDEKAAVRFGGIYALGRIGEDSDRDRRTIVQVLQAYIAETAPCLPRKPPSRPRRLLLPLRPRAPREEESRAREAAQALQAGTAKAAAEVLGRISKVLISNDGLRIDLKRTSLVGARMHHTRLSYALFTEADLRSTDFCDATFERAILTKANLGHALFRRVRAEGALLDGIRAHKTDFSKADLSNASLKDAQLIDATFEGANLQGADLRGVTATGTTLSTRTYVERGTTAKWLPLAM